MKKIFFLFLLFVGAKAFSQMVPFELGAIKLDSFQVANGVWISSVSTDTTFASPTNKQLATTRAIQKYVHSYVLSSTGSAWQDSIDKHTDTLQVHNTRIKAVETLAHSHSNKTVLDNTTAAFTTAQGTAISTATSTNSTQDGRLTAVEALEHSHSNKTVLDAITSAFTTAQATALSTATSTNTTQDGRLTAVETYNTHAKDTVEVQVICTDSTLSNTELATGNVFVISERLSGYNLTRVKIYSPSIGTGTVSSDVYRTRTSQVKMTSTPASLTTSANTAAVINASYAGVVVGDWIEIKYTDNGASLSKGLNIVLTFKKP